jgi:ubiquinone/menaquinone biosynthesis C-methylase UbiE
VSGERGKRLAAYYGARYGDRTAGGLNASARIRAELFASWIGTGKRLLELGCGSGSLLEAYAAGNRVTAMDIDTPALEACRQRLGVETVWGDFATELPFPDGSVDVVVAGETLEHMPYPPVFLGEVRRVLAAGGLFAGSVPNAYRYRNRLRVLSGKPIDTDPTHLQFFSLASLGALLSESFTVEEIVPIRGRWAGRWPSLFAHRFAWRCRR